MKEQVAIKRLEDHFEIHDDVRPHPFLDAAVSMAIRSLKAQTKLKEYVERINQPEYNDIVWKKDEVVLLLQELVAE